MLQDTYIFTRRKNGGDGCILQVPDSPSNIEAVRCKVLTAQILMSTRGPLLPLHVAHPFLKPGLVLQRKPLRDRPIIESFNSKHLSVIWISPTLPSCHYKHYDILR